MYPTFCLNCQQPASLLFVHGHYQCSSCGMNMLPCCDGDNCNTNWYLRQNDGHENDDTPVPCLETKGSSGETNHRNR